MYLRLKFLLCFLFMGFSVLAQEDNSFDKVYDRIWKETAHHNLDLAVSEADSLYKAVHIPVEQIRTLIMLARLFQQKEELSKSIAYVQKAETIAAEAKDYTWQARANAYLAGIYRMNELYAKAREYLDVAIKILPRIKDAEAQHSTRALLYQEQGFTYMDQEHYRQAISSFRTAGEGFMRTTHNKIFNLANNDRLLGDNYRLLESYDTAYRYYKNALKLSEGTPIHYTIGFMYKGLAELELNRENFDSAQVYLKKAEAIAEESEHLQLQEAVFDLSKEFHARMGNRDQLAEAREKRDSATGELLHRRAEFLDKTYKQLEQRGTKAEALNKRKTVVLGVTSVLLLAGTGFFVRYRSKHQQERAKFRDILAQMEQHKVEAVSFVPEQKAVEPLSEDNSEAYILQEEVNEEKKQIMPEETEYRLLQKLQELEAARIFLEQGFSFTVLATKMQTNAKYLSYLIKEHRNTDFNNYLNKLRIDYIMKTLKEQPEWRQYKISVLASETGFSSHSQFSAVFKHITGLSPSVFIKLLQSEEG